VAVPSGVILPYNGTHASVSGLTGWSRQTSLDDHYPLGAPASTNPDATGGSATHTHPTSGHTHTVSSHSHGSVTSANASTSTAMATGGTAVASTSHNHSIPASGSQTATLSSESPTTAAGSSLPSSYEVIWIVSDGNPTGVPNGGWALWASDPVPTNWTAQAGPAGKYLKGAATGADAGGSVGGTHVHAGASHDHAFSAHTHTGGTSGTPSATVNRATGADTNASASNHTHPVTVATAADARSGAQTSGDSGSGSTDPPSYKLAVIQNGTGAAAMPIGIIALWLGTLASIPSGWALCDGASGTPDLRDRMIVGAATNLSDLGGTSAGGNHSHTAPTAHSHNAAHTHQASLDSHTAAVGMILSGSTTSRTHSHAGTSNGSAGGTSGTTAETITAGTALPPYRTVAYIQLQSFPQTATPDPVTVSLALPAPTVALSFTATPSPVAVPVDIPAPTALLSTTVTPDPLTVPVAIPEPFLGGTDLTVTPDPVAVPVAPVGPTLDFGEITYTPNPVAIPVVTVDPTVSLAYIAQPDPVAVPIVAPAPTLLHGEVIYAPDPVAVPVTLAAPTVQLVYTVTPDPVVVTIALPEVVLGNFLGIVPVELPPPTAEQVHEALSGLYGDVSVRYRFSRRTRTNGLIDDIEGVPAGGAVTLDNARAVVRDLELVLDLDELPADFNLTGDILAVVVEVYVPQAEQWAPLQVGLFTLDAAETHYALGGSMSRLVPVRGADLAMLLAQSIRTAAYELPAGTHVIAAVEAILDRHGFAHALPAVSDTLPNAVSWPAGTSEWQICADLMFGVNCFPPTPDAQGVFRSRVRIDPSTETAAVTYRNTAEPRMVSARDRYIVGRDTKLPNRVRVVIDDPRNSGFGAVNRENADPDSPNSTAALAYGDAAAVSTSSVDNPTVITTAAAHGFSDGLQVLIAGHEGSVPDINGSHVVTVLSATTFSIPVSVTAAGSGGTVQATSVQLLEFKGDGTPSTIAVIDATKAGEIADYETRWAALQAEPVEVATFMDPRRSEREYVALDLDGIEASELFGVLGWRLELTPGPVMRHRLGRARAITVQESA